MNKICVIGVYFGKFPNYFSLWLKSCAYNPNVDFLIFTDNDLPSTENVKFYPMTLQEMQKRATAVLGFEASLGKPYKCCDYRVIYGLIFEEYLKGYEYWGHCDFDVIFGDLESFFEKFDLYKYDRFLALGHLSLYKNTKEVNERFKEEGVEPSYKDVYATDKGFAFDEINGMPSYYLKKGYPIFTKNIFSDISSLHHRYRRSEFYLLEKKPQNYKYQIFYWDKGRIYRAYFLKGNIYDEEYIYIHFRKRPNFTVEFDVDTVDSFYITNQGFIPKTGEVNKEIIKKLNKYHGALYEGLEKFSFWWKRKWTGLMRRIKKEV